MTQILCKGKVLYPSAVMTDADISRRLIQESSANNKTGSTITAPRLLVIGTPHAQQLPQRQSSKLSSWFYRWIIYPLVHAVWYFVQSFLDPFLPESLKLKRDWEKKAKIECWHDKEVSSSYVRYDITHTHTHATSWQHFGARADEKRRGLSQKKKLEGNRRNSFSIPAQLYSKSRRTLALCDLPRTNKAFVVMVWFS